MTKENSFITSTPACLRCCTFDKFGIPSEAFQVRLNQALDLYQLNYEGNIKILVPFHSGKLHGFVRVFEEWFGQTNLTMLAFFQDGVLRRPGANVIKLFTAVSHDFSK